MIFSDWAKGYNRIAVVGGPKAGKTTLSLTVKDRYVLHTDDFIDVNWDKVPQKIIDDLAQHDKFLVEGVQAARALRKGLQVDVIVTMNLPPNEEMFLQDGQQRMGKAVATIMKDVDVDIPRINVEDIL